MALVKPTESAALEKFGREFWERFWYFRRIEADIVLAGPFTYSSEAFALLRDAELCYASKAYFACIVMTHSILEIHLSRVEGFKGSAVEMFRKAGIDEDVRWLRKLRNAIAHGNPNNEIVYGVDDELEEIWDGYCIKAFKFMHELPIRMFNANRDTSATENPPGNSGQQIRP